LLLVAIKKSERLIYYAMLRISINPISALTHQSAEIHA
jgi:hypothetical protein